MHAGDDIKRRLGGNMKERNAIILNAKSCTRITAFEMGEKEPGITWPCGREIGCEVETRDLPNFIFRT